MLKIYKHSEHFHISWNQYKAKRQRKLSKGHIDKMSSVEKYVNLNEEEKNGIRLQILRQNMDEVLRKKFHDYFPEDGVRLYNILVKHKKTFKELMKKGVLRKSQFDIILPSNCLTDSSKFDTTLLSLLLCGSDDTKNGFRLVILLNPSDIENIKIVRGARNEMQHTNLSVPQVQYDNIFTKVEPAMANLEFPKYKIDQIRTHIIDKNLGAKFLQSHQSFAYNFTIPVSNFFGRKEKVDEIHKKIESVSNAKNKYGVVVYGMAGVGKSETVRKYFIDYKIIYNAIVWFNAETKESIEFCFTDVANQIGIKTDSPPKSIKEIIHQVYSHFSVIKENEDETKMLFIFDNVKDMQYMEDLLPSSSDNIPSILITSQNRRWDKLRFETVELDIWNSDVAEAFVQKELDPSDYSINECLKLISILENHPLAIQQALSYMRINENMNLKCYIQLFESTDWKIITAEDIGNYIGSHSVFKTFSLSIQNLCDSNIPSEAVELLRTLAYIDGKHIEEKLLVKFYGVDTLTMSLTVLDNFSLITRRMSMKSVPGNVVTMHSLVQHTIKEINRSNDKMDHYIDIIFNVIRDDFSDENMKERGNLTFKHFIRLCVKKDTKNLIIKRCMHDDYYFKLIEVFRIHRHLDILLEIADSILQIEIEEGATQPSYLNATIRKIRCLILWIIYEKGGLDIVKLLISEISCNRKINNEFIKQQTKDNPQYAYALNVFQKVNNWQNEFSANEGLVAKIVLNFIADRDYQKALKLLEKSSSEMDDSDLILNEFKPEKIDTARAKGQYQEVLQLLEETENFQLKTHHEKDPEILDTKIMIASTLLQLRKYEKSLKKYREIEQLQLKIFNTDVHPEVLSTRNNIAIVHLNACNYTQALSAFKLVEQSRLKLLSSNHPDYLMTKYYIVVTLLKMGEDEKALDRLRDVKVSKLNVTNSNYKNLEEIKYKIGKILLKMEKYEDALETFQRIENHGENFKVFFQIGVTYFHLKKYEEALGTFRKIEKENQSNVLDLNHIQLLATKQNIGRALLRMAKFEDALATMVEVQELELLDPDDASMYGTKETVETINKLLTFCNNFTQY